MGMGKAAGASPRPTFAVGVDAHIDPFALYSLRNGGMHKCIPYFLARGNLKVYLFVLDIPKLSQNKNLLSIGGILCNILKLAI